MSPPTVRNIHSLWHDTELSRAKRDEQTIPIFVPTGPLPHPINWNRPEYQVRRAISLNPDASISSSPRGASPRKTDLAAVAMSTRRETPYEIMARLGPPPMTTVLAGPQPPRRSPRTPMGGVSLPPPGSTAPIPAPASPRGM